MQAAPRSFQRTRPNQEQQHHTQAPQAPTPHGQRTAPLPAKFKLAKITAASNSKPSPFDPNSQNRIHRHSGQQQGGMGPPPTPLHVRQKHSPNTAIQINYPNPNTTSTSESIQVRPVNTHPRTNRFVPPDHHPAQLQTSTGTSPRFMPSSTRPPSRIAPFNISGGNQRMPFVPGARGSST
jgi:hypothetical protein